MSYLETKEIRKSFIKGGALIEVLKGVNLVYEKGSFVSIVGASGAGKSTLLHVMGGLDRPTSGELFFEGKCVYSGSDHEIATYRSKKIGFVFQFHHLLTEFSAVENVAIPMMIAGASRRASMERSRGLLNEVGLGSRLEHKPGELSGGEQQRVSIARALSNGPDLLFLDEPTGNLDSRTGREIFDLLIQERKNRGMSLIMVTHNEDLADKAEQKIRLKDGLAYAE